MLYVLHVFDVNVNHAAMHASSYKGFALMVLSELHAV